jgi:hypothetical protein
MLYVVVDTQTGIIGADVTVQKVEVDEGVLPILPAALEE